MPEATADTVNPDISILVETASVSCRADSFHAPHMTVFVPHMRLVGELLELHGLRKDGSVFPIELSPYGEPKRTSCFVVGSFAT